MENMLILTTLQNCLFASDSSTGHSDNQYRDLLRRAEAIERRRPEESAVFVLDAPNVTVEEKVAKLLNESAAYADWNKVVGPVMKKIFTPDELFNSCVLNSDKSVAKRKVLDSNKVHLTKEFLKEFLKSSKCQSKPKKAVTDPDFNVQLARICNQQRRHRSDKNASQTSTSNSSADASLYGFENTA